MKYYIISSFFLITILLFVHNDVYAYCTTCTHNASGVHCSCANEGHHNCQGCNGEVGCQCSGICGENSTLQLGYFNYNSLKTELEKRENNYSFISFKLKYNDYKILKKSYSIKINNKVDEFAYIIGNSLIYQIDDNTFVSIGNIHNNKVIKQMLGESYEISIEV